MMWLHWQSRGRIGPGLLVTLLLTLTLAACGGKSATDPTATPAPEVTATPAPESTTTVGALAARITSAYAAVTSYTISTETTSPILPLPTGSVEGQTGEMQVTSVVEEVVLPDRRHQLVRVGSEVRSDLLAIQGQLYGRGAALPGLASKLDDPNEWHAIDLADAVMLSQYVPFYQQFDVPPPPPLATVTDDMREREANPVEQITVDDRTCTVFSIPDLTLTGDQKEVLLSIDPTGLPCTIETRAGGTSTLTTYRFGVPDTLEAPANPRIIPTPALAG